MLSLVRVVIIGGKVWVQYDSTNRPIAEEFVAASIPLEDIVLGFQPPERRPYTNFVTC